VCILRQRPRWGGRKKRCGGAEWWGGWGGENVFKKPVHYPLLFPFEEKGGGGKKPVKNAQNQPKNFLCSGVKRGRGVGVEEEVKPAQGGDILVSRGRLERPLLAHRKGSGRSCKNITRKTQGRQILVSPGEWSFQDPFRSSFAFPSSLALRGGEGAI